MNVNHKQLVINTVSIFLALGIGLFIGLVMNSGNLVETGTGDVVAQIEEQFEYLKEENQKNKEEIQRVNDANIQLDYSMGIFSGRLMQNQLSDRNIALVMLSDNYDYSDIKSTLEKAGANVSSVTTVNSEFYKDKNKLGEILKQNDLEDVRDDEIYPYFADTIIKGVSKGEKADIFERLISENLISYGTGDTANNPEILEDGTYIESIQPDSIVICSGFNNEVKNASAFEDKVLEELKSENKNTVGVEVSDAKVSLIQKYRDNGLSNVNNIDSNIGKLSMVLSLKGYSGNYGDGSTEDTQVPDLTLFE